MSREIKFRAWLKHDGEWLMSYDLAFEDYEPINDLLAGVDHLMQYTGLKDKNGVEIYEGDILEGDGILGHIFYRTECMKFVLKEIVENHSLHTGQPQPVNEIEVIGNIYENPELLEAQS